MTPRRRIAIIGSGIAGNTAAWALHRDHDVTIYEAEPRPGGHTRTSTFVIAGRRYDVDTGFIVYNELTYPRFTTLLAELGVDTEGSDMSFGANCEKSGLEYGTADLNALFAQRRNVLSPRFLGVWRDFHRFARETRELAELVPIRQTLGDYLLREKYTPAFRDWFVVPMAAAIWSAKARDILDFPLSTFLRFMHNHRMLQPSGQPEWRVVRGGSQNYLTALYARMPINLLCNSPVKSIVRHADYVSVRTAADDEDRFDGVVLACHAPTALQLLADPSRAERDILGAIRYQPNTAILHTDIGVLPKRRAAWASWNYHVPSDPLAPVSVTYDMNRLQNIAGNQRFLVTLNREQGIADDRILEKVAYEHPIFDVAAIEAQARWSSISGQRRTFFAGAYWRFGFHEDGVFSGQRAARQVADVLASAQPLQHLAYA